MGKITTKVKALGEDVLLDQFDLASASPLVVAIVDGSGNQITTFGGSGGTSETDDSPFTAGSDAGTPAMGLVTSDSVDSGDVGVIGMLANRQQKVTLYDSSGVEVAVGGGTQYAEDTVLGTTPTGTLAMTKTSNVLVGLVAAPGDAASLRSDRKGSLWVRTSESATTVIAGLTNTSIFQGIRVFQQNSPSVTIESPTLAGLEVNIKKATTSVLAGARVFVNNPAGAQAVNIQDGGNSITVDGTVTASIATSTLAGLKTDVVKLGNVPISLNTGVRDAGTQRVTIATNDSVPVTGTFFQATQPVSVITSTLAGLQTDIRKVGGVVVTNLPVNIAAATTSVLAGTRIDNRTIVGTAIDVNSGNKSAGTQRVVLATDQPNVPVNIAAVTTSTLAGIKVNIKNDNVPTVTTAVVGIVASAAGDTKLVPAQGAGKRIYVYAWNMSFAGTVNAKLTDGTTSKILAGLIYGIANAGGGNSVSPNFLLKTPQPALFYTSENSSLYINLSGSVAVGGSISWFTV